MCEILTLYRGCRSIKERENIFKNCTARGYNPANPATTPPTEEEANGYVGSDEHFPNPYMEELNNNIPTLVEYTTDQRIAFSYGISRGGVIKISIEKRYCTKGSGSENGYIIRRDAPVVYVYDYQLNSTNYGNFERVPCR